jgi:hypothetical protein
MLDTAPTYPLTAQSSAMPQLLTIWVEVVLVVQFPVRHARGGGRLE